MSLFGTPYIFIIYDSSDNLENFAKCYFNFWDFAALVELQDFWMRIFGSRIEVGNRVLSLVGLTAPQVLVIGSMIIFLSLSLTLAL